MSESGITDSGSPAHLYRIASAEEWQAMQQEGKLSEGALDTRDSFVHLSTLEQLAESVAKHFPGQEGLLALCIDAAALGDSLRWEKVPSRDDACFPHLYGPLLLRDVLGTHRLFWGADGGLELGEFEGALHAESG